MPAAWLPNSATDLRNGACAYMSPFHPTVINLEMFPLEDSDVFL